MTSGPLRVGGTTRARAWLAAVGAAWFALPADGPLYARAVAIAALALIFSQRASAIAGALFASLAWLAPSAWLGACVTLSLALPLLVSSERSARRSLAIALAIGALVPLAFFGVVTIAGGADVVRGIAREAIPREPALALALCACRTLAAVAALRAIDLRGRVGAIVALGAATVAVAREATVLSMMRVDGELFWPEAPMLVNALKLANHEILYGAPDALDSYSYSPLLDLVHRALLRPFGLELDLFAHRALVLGDQLGAFAILLWTLGPRLARAPLAARTSGVALLAFAALSNLLAPAVHPDHPLLVCFAIAIAVTLAGERMPARVRDALFVLVTPVATAFKLSGAGIGLGLAIVTALPMRRGRARRDLALLALSGALTVLTIPLFDRLLGRFSFYAIALQRSHPMEWSHFLAPPWPSFGAFGLGALVVVVLALRHARAASNELHAPLVALLVLSASMVLFSVPGAAKYAGRDNNFAVAFVGATAALVLVAAQLPRFGAPALGIALWGALATRPPSPPVGAVERAAIASETAALADVVRADAARGEQTLLLTTVLPWIRAGRRDVPRDRWHSAIELYFGRFPEGDLLRARIAERRYATVIAAGDELSARAGPAGAFQVGIVEALRAGYVQSRGDERARTRALVFRRARVIMDRP